MKVLTLIILFIYGGLALFYLIFYLKINGIYEKGPIVLLTGVLIASLIAAFYGFKNKQDDQNNIVLSLYLYPLLFLTQFSGSSFLSYSYIIIFTTVIALWGFFGVEWFVGPNNSDVINTKTCKAYLGISDDQLLTPNTMETETKMNTRNISFMFIALGLIFVVFVMALIFTYLTVQKISA